MLPLPMNEFVQQNLKRPVAWMCNLMWSSGSFSECGPRHPDSPNLKGAMVLNVSSPSSDVGVMARYFSSANFPPNGFNFEQWKDDAFDNALTTLAEASDPAVISSALRKAHERLVDNPPWILYRARPQPARDESQVKGFVSPQSWFIDLTLVSM